MFIISILNVMNEKMLKIICITVTITNSLKEERRRHGMRPTPFSIFFPSALFRKPAAAV